MGDRCGVGASEFLKWIRRILRRVHEMKVHEMQESREPHMFVFSPSDTMR